MKLRTTLQTIAILCCGALYLSPGRTQTTSSQSAAGVVQQGSITIGNATKWMGNNLVADGGTLDQMTFTQPSTGFSATIPDNIRFYIIGNGTLLAGGTLTMPANPVDGQRVTVSSRGAITLFTMSANTGQTLYGGLNTLVSGGFGTWIYRASDLSWYRIA